MSKHKKLVDDNKTPHHTDRKIATKIIYVILGIGFVIALFTTSTKSPKTNMRSKASYLSAVKQACNVLTQSIADRYVGINAKKYSIPDTKLLNANISYCSYTGDNGSISLYIRSALNNTGAEDNNKRFASNMPTNTHTLNGYGDSAYWLNYNGDFNILSKSNIYTINLGLGTSFNHTESQTEKAAKDIINNF